MFILSINTNILDSEKKAATEDLFAINSRYQIVRMFDDNEKRMLNETESDAVSMLIIDFHIMPSFLSQQYR